MLTLSTLSMHYLNFSCSLATVIFTRKIEKTRPVTRFMFKSKKLELKMEGQLMQNILQEFEKNNSQTSELLRIQSDLSNCEEQLVSLKIRFDYK